MLRFPHGIRRAFLRPVWAPFRRCLPLLALLHSCPEDGDGDDLLMNEAQHDAGCLLPTKSGEFVSNSSPIADEGLLLLTNADHADGDLRPYNGEDLLPHSGEEDGHILPQNGEEAVGDLQPTRGDDDEADQSSLQPAYKEGHKEEKGASQPADNGAENEDLQPLPNGTDSDSLLPKQIGDDEDQSAVNSDLRPPLQGGKHEETKGCPPPLNGGDNPQVDSSSNCNLHIRALQIDMQNTVVPAINEWLKPSPRPRVKMKDNLQQYDAHAWKHDARASSSSPSHLSFTANLADAASSHGWLSNGEASLAAKIATFRASQRMHSIHVMDIRQAYDLVLLPCEFMMDDHNAGFFTNLIAALQCKSVSHFTPLRGRKVHQAREMQDELQMMARTGSKTKTKTMQMRLSYLMKDMLDPG